MMNHRRSNWIFKRWLCAFCFFILYPAMGIDVCSASLLKDIRIGDHIEYTRIVFVFDAQPSGSHFETISTKELRIAIKAAKPDLIRKIQFAKSHNIEDIRIVTGRNQLSAILSTRLAHIKVTSFQLEKPARLVFDISWQTAEAASTEPLPAQGQSEETSSADHSTNEIGPAQEVTTNHLSETTVAEPVKNTSPSTLPVESENEQSEAPPSELLQATGSEKESTADVGQASTETTVKEKTVPPDLIEDGAQEPKQAAGWLQYYLVIALVILTIAILFLLVLMLLSKYRLTNDTDHLSASEYLKRQDKHLSSLDERIKQQLKKYDEA